MNGIFNGGLDLEYRNNVDWQYLIVRFNFSFINIIGKLYGDNGIFIYLGCTGSYFIILTANQRGLELLKG
jgi:hypothetical protein